MLIRDLDTDALQAERTRILQRLARERATGAALLLIVEDLHWARPSLTRSLADVAASIDDLPMALLFTTRPEGDPIDNAWRIRAGKTSTTTIYLQALRPQDALELARSLRDLDPGLLDQCLARADGNPLFIEQLVLWAGQQADTNVPLSVQSVVQERLDKLPEATRALARTASVLGQAFKADALEAVFDGDMDLVRQLDEAHLVMRRGRTFSFVHALVRDGIYASISPKARQALHMRAAGFFAQGDPVLSARHAYWSGTEEASRICFEAAENAHRSGRLDSGCYAAMFMGPQGRLAELARYLDESDQVAGDLGLVWVLPWVLASRARWNGDPAAAAAALDRAEELVFSGRTSYPFEFFYVGIDAALKLKDWPRAELYADRLDQFFASEPVALPAFVSARARALAAAGQGRGDADELRRLVALAAARGLTETGTALQAALQGCDPGL